MTKDEQIQALLVQGAKLRDHIDRTGTGHQIPAVREWDKLHLEVYGPIAQERQRQRNEECTYPMCNCPIDKTTVCAKKGVR